MAKKVSHPNHLCIIVDRATNAQVAEYEVSAADWYYARHIAARNFSDEHAEDAKTLDWFVDSIELTSAAC